MNYFKEKTAKINRKKYKYKSTVDRIKQYALDIFNHHSMNVLIHPKFRSIKENYVLAIQINQKELCISHEI